MIKNRIIIVCLCVFNTFVSMAQNESENNIDSQYKEDQFYVGVTYNLLIDGPNDLKQRGFSPGIHFGFIKDMPINKARNKAIGLGIGLSSNSFNQNLLIQKNTDNNYAYSIIEDTDSFSKNKFATHYVEIPLELRWRTSTPTDYAFWRIYTGIKFSYMLYQTTTHKGDLGRFNYSNVPDFDPFQYGLTLSAGYNTWNLHLYYGLNTIFSKDALIDGTPIDLKTIKVGLLFFIL